MSQTKGNRGYWRWDTEKQICHTGLLVIPSGPLGRCDVGRSRCGRVVCWFYDSACEQNTYRHKGEASQIK
eukprot:scaffold332803_cov41-Prasinocladus_malaysianus.AAC.1